MNLEELISEAKKGSRRAQDILFNALHDKYLNVCKRYIKNAADAEERMLDGFYKFYKSLADFNYISDAGVYACIRKIMVNECIMQLRKKNNFSLVIEPAESDAVLEDDILDKMSIAEINAKLNSLPTAAKTIFNLYVIDGFRHHEIAELLSISVGTSKSQLSRAKLLLRQSLAYLNINHETRTPK